jgi:hypothetical protein
MAYYKGEAFIIAELPLPLLIKGGRVAKKVTYG